MGNTATKNNNDNSKFHKLQKQKNLTNEQQQITVNTATATTIPGAPAPTTAAAITTVGDQQYNFSKNQQSQQSKAKKLNVNYQQQQKQIENNILVTKTTTAENTAAVKRSSSVKATTTTTAAAAAAAEKQSQKQNSSSTWSLGSLSARHFNWSFSGSGSHTASVRNSFRQRNKSTRKSLTSVQQLRRSKTTWHKPITNAIFNSHFKESSSSAHANHLRNFHIEQLVAKGAFGIVFKVTIAADGDKRDKQTINAAADSSATTTTTTHTFYALKVLKKSKILTENSVQQIKDEADIQKLCGHHPFIVQQIDLWQNRHNLHILSEYVPNGELFTKIANFSLDLIRLYLAEIAIAVDFLHNAGIIYRDAKPENILLTQNFHIKLTDFGLSKWLKLGMTTRTMCGTFQYMAPEILRGEAYGHAVDWWSLGIIVCQMAIQRCPDFRQFLQLTFPPATTKSTVETQPVPATDSVDRAQPADHNEISCSDHNDETGASVLQQKDFLPAEVEQLPHEIKDVLKRLLVIDPKQRLRSVLALQRIALYKNFKIDAKHLLSISAVDIISRDHIQLYESSACVEANSVLATKAFHDF